MEQKFDAIIVGAGPAVCFKLGEGHIVFSYEGCLACDNCRIASTKKAIGWICPLSVIK